VSADRNGDEAARAGTATVRVADPAEAPGADVTEARASDAAEVRGAGAAANRAEAQGSDAAEGAPWLECGAAARAL